jgi:hypothetical protein
MRSISPLLAVQLTIEARGICRVVEVDLHRRKALILDPWKLPVRLFPNRNVHIRVAIDANLLAELSAHELVDGQFQSLAGKIPQRNFDARQSRDVLPALCAGEDPAVRILSQIASTSRGSRPMSMRAANRESATRLRLRHP